MIDTDIADFLEDSTPYVSAESTKSLASSMESIECRIFKWFPENQLKGNVDECHVLLSSNEKVATNFDSAQIENTLLKNYCESPSAVN